MSERETSKDIEQAAAEWLARVDRAPLSAEESADLECWLAGDARRRGAWVRAKALWMRAETLRGHGQLHELPVSVCRVAVRPPARSSRRNARRHEVLRWSGAVAASALLVAFLFVSIPAPTAYATAKGEMRRVPLADGSTLTLNTESKVKVYDERGRLRVKVVRGEVFIEAAAGDEPLMIEIDGRHLDAHAAAFVVRKLDDQPAQVVVQDGNVEIPGGNAATNLTPNTRLLVQGKPGEVATVPLSADDLRRELAWREGKIAFQGETLADAARSFSRYSDTRLIIADTKLANEPVAGLFATSNPAGFARAVAAAFDAQVRQQDNEVIISRE